MLVREKVGQYEIQIVIDCKDYSKPVDVKGVEEFYGLFQDVGAQKGVLVCPKGFSEAGAKSRAERWQIDLYSPFDTDIHKWQVKATIPALCDFRTAAMSFQIRMSAPFPFKLVDDFFSTAPAFDSNGGELGTAFVAASAKWDGGGFPSEPGEHAHLPIFDTLTVQADNGYGMRLLVDLYVSLLVGNGICFTDNSRCPKCLDSRSKFRAK